MQSSQDHISWREVQNKSFSHTHTPTQLDQKITVHATLILRSRDINSTGFHIETAPVDDIEGCNGKESIYLFFRAQLVRWLFKYLVVLE